MPWVTKEKWDKAQRELRDANTKATAEEKRSRKADGRAGRAESLVKMLTEQRDNAIRLVRRHTYADYMMKKVGKLERDEPIHETAPPTTVSELRAALRDARKWRDTWEFRAKSMRLRGDRFKRMLDSGRASQHRTTVHLLRERDEARAEARRWKSTASHENRKYNRASEDLRYKGLPDPRATGPLRATISPECTATGIVIGGPTKPKKKGQKRREARKMVKHLRDLIERKQVSRKRAAEIVEEIENLLK